MPSDRIKKLGRETMRPIGAALANLGITANTITLIGLLFAGLCGFFLATGEWFFALLALLLSGGCDMLDGAVARAGGGSGTTFGAAFDSTVDRYGEALILGGILIDATNHGVGPAFLALWVLTLTAGFLTSYVRARAEGLGFRCEVGLLERPERLVLLSLLCILGRGAAGYILAVLAIGGHITVFQRLHLVWRASRSGGDRS